MFTLFVFRNVSLGKYVCEKVEESLAHDYQYVMALYEEHVITTASASPQRILLKLQC